MIHRYYPYTIELHAPLIVSRTMSDANSASTYDYISGSAIRGAVAGPLADTATDDAASTDFRTLVLDGDVRYLNAYPTDNWRRCLPAPVSFRVDKGRTTRAFDLAAFTGQGDPDEAEEDSVWPRELDALPYPYISLGAADLRGIRPRAGSQTHHQRDRERGRPWVDRRGAETIPHGGPFTYEHLEAGQRFSGLIHIRGSSEAECGSRFSRLRAILPSTLLLGRSRRAGYGGQATITWGEPEAREVTGEGVVACDLPAGAQFRALLTSPCIVRDRLTGELDPQALIAELTDRLGQTAEVVRRRWAFDIAGGFNRKWRLETPQARAAAAGSVFVLVARQPIPLGQFLDIENEGIGERLTEGFGRVVFLEGPRAHVRVTAPAGSEPVRPEGGAPEIVQFIERRVMQEAAWRQIEQGAAQAVRSATRIPTPSLLGRLRLALRAGPAAGLETLRTWLGTGGEAALRRAAMDQLEGCRIKLDGKTETLAKWMRLIADAGSPEARQELERLLRLHTVAQRSHVVSEASAGEHLRRMSDELAARLIDAVLEGLARRKRREASAR